MLITCWIPHWAEIGVQFGVVHRYCYLASPSMFNNIFFGSLKDSRVYAELEVTSPGTSSSGITMSVHIWYEYIHSTYLSVF
jgi:hypothetical protein